MLQRAFRGIVGVLILAGAALSTWHHPNWIYFTVFLGVMLLQSGITDRCPLLWLLKKAGLRECGSPDRISVAPAASST